MVRKPRLTKLGIAAVLLLLAAGGFFLFHGGIGANAQSPSSSPTSSGAASEPSDLGPGFSADGTGGDTRVFRGPHAGGKVTAINGNSITLQDMEGGSITVNVTGSTTIERAGVKSPLSSIHVNDYIAVRGTQSGSTIQATDIRILLPGAGGVVTKVSDSTITVNSFDDTTQTIKVDSNTRYQRAGKSASLSDIKVGSRIFAEGTKNSDGSLRAELVAIHLPHVLGQVSAVNGSNITITSFFGETRTVVTSGSTAYSQPDGTKASASAVKVGSRIAAEGTLSSDGKTLQAERITVLPAGGPQGFFNHGKMGFPGPDGGPGMGLHGPEGAPGMGFRGFWRSGPRIFQQTTPGSAAPIQNT